jgi:hypothetical protein
MNDSSQAEPASLTSNDAMEQMWQLVEQLDEIVTALESLRAAMEDQPAEAKVMMDRLFGFLGSIPSQREPSTPGWCPFLPRSPSYLTHHPSCKVRGWCAPLLGGCVHQRLAKLTFQHNLDRLRPASPKRIRGVDTPERAYPVGRKVELVGKVARALAPVDAG